MTEGLDAVISVEVVAQVQHHPPCVPECLVCNPSDAEED
jgi:hypothetical protein